MAFGEEAQLLAWIRAGGVGLRGVCALDNSRGWSLVMQQAIAVSGAGIKRVQGPGTRHVVMESGCLEAVAYRSTPRQHSTRQQE